MFLPMARELELDYSIWFKASSPLLSAAEAPGALSEHWGASASPSPDSSQASALSSKPLGQAAKGK